MDAKSRIGCIEMVMGDSEKEEDVEVQVCVAGIDHPIRKDGVLWDSENDQIIIYCD